MLDPTVYGKIVFHRKRRFSNGHKNSFIAPVGLKFFYFGATFHGESKSEDHFFMGST